MWGWLPSPFLFFIELVNIINGILSKISKSLLEKNSLMRYNVIYIIGKEISNIMGKIEGSIFCKNVTVKSNGVISFVRN